MKNWIAGIVCAAVVLSAGAAFAFPPFKAAFAEKYAEPSDNAEFKDAVKTASCNACHVKGESKKVRNEYGMALHEVLEEMIEGSLKDALKEDKEGTLKALDKAMDKVAEMKSESGKTFGEKIKAGVLPGE